VSFVDILSLLWLRIICSQNYEMMEAFTRIWETASKVLVVCLASVAVAGVAFTKDTVRRGHYNFSLAVMRPLRDRFFGSSVSWAACDPRETYQLSTSLSPGSLLHIRRVIKLTTSQLSHVHKMADLWSPLRCSPVAAVFYSGRPQMQKSAYNFLTYAIHRCKKPVEIRRSPVAMARRPS